MNNRRFARRLAQELPRWEAQGWLRSGAAPLILAELEGTRAPFASVLALVGSVLLGLGVITWFAAHWNEMGKLARLLLVFGVLIGSHAAHGLCLAREGLPRLAGGLALLSSLLFGAAIMLIGQIYHIDAHFPDGIALWSLGSLLAAWMFGLQPVLILALGLAALWNGFEQFDYGRVNGLLPVFLAASGALLVRQEWRFASRAWGLLALFWIAGWHGLPWLDGTGGDLAHVRLLAVQVLGVAGLWAFCQATAHPFARQVRPGFLLFALIGVFLFTFPTLRPSAPASPPSTWIGALALSAAFYAGGIFRLARSSGLPPPRLVAGLALAAFAALLLVVEVVTPWAGSVPALIWNAIFLAVLYWIGDLGVRQGDAALVNSAFAGFVVWLLARYFDTFWSLLDRALFFMAGGVLLMAVGGWVEWRRRRLLRDLAPAEPP
jgi:uncharacterized membrane protein